MENKFNKIILVPTDFSEVCDNAVNYGAQLAAFLGYKLTLLHVLNKDSRQKLKKEKKNTDDISGELKAISEKLRSGWLIDCDYTVREGSIFNVIHKTSSELGAELVILGVHGKKGMQYLIGSHALRVITTLSSPAIVVQNKEFREIKKTVIPVTDFTESRQSVQWAIHIAKVFGGKIHLFQQNQPDPGLNAKIDIMTKQITDAFDKANINYLISKAPKKGHLPRQILDYSKTNHCDLVVIMTEPDVYSPDFNMGPWDEKIMFNEYEIPVMCINPIDLGKTYNQYLSLL